MEMCLKIFKRNSANTIVAAGIVAVGTALGCIDKYKTGSFFKLTLFQSTLADQQTYCLIDCKKVFISGPVLSC